MNPIQETKHVIKEIDESPEPLLLAVGLLLSTNIAVRSAAILWMQHSDRSPHALLKKRRVPIQRFF